MTTTSGGVLQVPPFSSRPTVIPQVDEEGRWTGEVVKVEQVLLRGLDGGARLHLWLLPDPRIHNYPWEWIACKVLRGWYHAVEYEPDGEGGYEYDLKPLHLHAGDPERRLGHATHHQVVAVAPGTVSVMSFGPVVGDGKQWGHLARRDGVLVHEPAPVMGGFADALRHCNPHLRQEGWSDPYAGQTVPDVAKLVRDLFEVAA